MVTGGRAGWLAGKGRLSDGMTAGGSFGNCQLCNWQARIICCCCRRLRLSLLLFFLVSVIAVVTTGVGCFVFAVVV